MNKYICIHCHFYQPPRENPWLEAIEIQDSAYPHHDWNERITEQCYAANAASRILSGTRIGDIVNNYSLMSFNFGPTLLSWLQDKKPDVYEKILEADKISAERLGYGNAIAQAYNHMILPLANDRDAITQIQWGIADFKYRFQRDPDGMWLPETAVNLAALEKLADNGIRYTIIAPNQCLRIRALQSKQWEDVSHSNINTARPYLVRLPHDKSICVFVYNKEVSQAVAFEKLLESGQKFVGRLMGQFNLDTEAPQLVNIATDGETYGHHFPFGDMGLAFAFSDIQQQNLAEIINYAAYLEKFPPEYELEIFDNSSWSCAHGIERWKSNCGCRMNPATLDQNWRAPLREALDWLRDTIAPLFEQAMNQYFYDPWRVRNHYIQVILDRTCLKAEKFFQPWAKTAINEDNLSRILSLLEMQRHALLMYTSCAWFFDDISGLETRQVLQYAARVIQLGETLFQQDLESGFLDKLQYAKSNYPQFKNGKEVYLKLIKPQILHFYDVAAHYAINSLFYPQADSKFFYCYEAKIGAEHYFELGKSKLLCGDADFVSHMTKEQAHYDYIAVHFRDQNVICGINDDPEKPVTLEKMNQVKTAFLNGDFPAVNQFLQDHYSRQAFNIKSLFRDEQRKVVAYITEENLDAVNHTFQQLYDERFVLISYLKDLSIPLPASLCALATYVLNDTLMQLANDFSNHLKEFVTQLNLAKRIHIQFEPTIAYALQHHLETLMQRLIEIPEDEHLLKIIIKSLRVLAILKSFPINLWHMQNLYFSLTKQIKQFESPAESRFLKQFQRLGDYLNMDVSL